MRRNIERKEPPAAEEREEREDRANAENRHSGATEGDEQRGDQRSNRNSGHDHRLRIGARHVSRRGR